MIPIKSPLAFPRILFLDRLWAELFLYSWNLYITITSVDCSSVGYVMSGWEPDAGRSDLTDQAKDQSDKPVAGQNSWHKSQVITKL